MSWLSSFWSFFGYGPSGEGFEEDSHFDDDLPRAASANVHMEADGYDSGEDTTPSSSWNFFSWLSSFFASPKPKIEAFIEDDEDLMNGQVPYVPLHYQYAPKPVHWAVRHKHGLFLIALILIVLAVTAFIWYRKRRVAAAAAEESDPEKASDAPTTAAVPTFTKD